MRPAHIVWISMLLIAAPASGAGICVVVNGGCKDTQTGTVHVYEGGNLVDPETKQIYMETPKPSSYGDTQSVRIDRGPTNYVMTMPAEEDVNAFPEEEPEEQRNPKVGQQLRVLNNAGVPNNVGAINAVTGEFYAPAGQGYVGTRDGTYYAPAGPSGVIDTRTGQFIPMH